MPQPYQADLPNLRRALATAGRLEEILALPAYHDFTPEMIDAVLEEGAKFAAEVLSPINAEGDRVGCTWKGGEVTSAQGFKSAYRQFIENGWNGAPVPVEHGGQGLPCVVATLLAEMWHGANMSFGLAPMLTQGAIEMLSRFGSETLKEAYLPKLISGEWAGTMCMTEPQAGSDVGAVRTRVEEVGAGELENWRTEEEESAAVRPLARSPVRQFRITGTKIFITWGEHDLTENIIHMVLARLPDAPAGTKGLSLFLVPKILPDGMRNKVTCVSIEHKMGINASPTCVLDFSGATGWLIGEANKGMATMFAMMNAARFAVGLEAVGVAGYASQLAHAYAKERMQNGKTIDKHHDVARMLSEIKAHSEGLRALALYTASYMDIARAHPDAAERAKAQARVDLLIPVVKAHSSQVGFEVCSTAMQVFGGMGYIEEAGISQLLRDVRITQIYEGTNGIQALDLVNRKLPMEGYGVVEEFLKEVSETEKNEGRHPRVCEAETGDPAFPASSGGSPVRASVRPGMTAVLSCSLIHLREATDRIRKKQESGEKDAVAEVASTYLTLFGQVAEAYALSLTGSHG